MDGYKLIEIEKAVPRLSEIAFKQPVNWSIKKGEHWAIIGPNGAGKTVLADLLTGKYALKTGSVICRDEEGTEINVASVIKSVAFRDIYSLSDIQNSYYQQRWNAGDVHDVPLVMDLFKIKENDDREWLNFLIKSFAIQDLINKKINLLSSGELRKFLIVRSLLSKPRILILDNPFIGLDSKSREVLNDVLTKLSLLEQLQIVLILSNPSDIPEIITHILPVKNMSITTPVLRTDFMKNEELQAKLFYNEKKISVKKAEVKRENLQEFDNALVFKDIHVKYGTRVILNKLNWRVRRGEKWALLGENGSGKSTLLSLVFGDNPQAYANNITLFDRKRGTGESIWDIKRRIGYISPEMHLYYLKNINCLDIVASGFFDTIGLYMKCNEKQRSEALKWMDIFGVEYLKDTSFLNVSTGEQRLVLLARTFVKNPDLYILDEPLHGLDVANKHRVKDIIEKFCTKDKSLIYVTHYKNEIPSIVDKQLVLSKYQND